MRPEELTGPHAATPAGKPRARSLGIPFGGTPGRWNAITDVPGVELGYATTAHGAQGDTTTAAHLLLVRDICTNEEGFTPGLPDGFERWLRLFSGGDIGNGYIGPLVGECLRDAAPYALRRARHDGGFT